MRSKNVIITTLLFMVCCSNLSAQSTQFNDSLKRVPYVVYTPFELMGEIQDAFINMKGQDCFLLSKNSENDFYYFNRSGPKGGYNLDHIGSVYMRGATARGDEDREIEESYYRSPNIKDYRDIIMANDSCFFFSLYPSRNFYAEILGIKRGGELTFIDNNGSEFKTLESLIFSQTGGKSLEEFIDLYLNDYKNAMYSVDIECADNRLYHIGSVDEAVSVLRDNYNYKYLNNKTDTTLAINNFVKEIGDEIPITDSVRRLISTEIYDFLRSNVQTKPFNETFSEYLYSHEFDFFPVMTQNIAPILKNKIADDQYTLLTKKFKLRRAKAAIAQFALEEVKLKEKSKKNVFPYPGATIVILPSGFKYEEVIDSYIRDFKIFE